MILAPVSSSDLYNLLLVALVYYAMLRIKCGMHVMFLNFTLLTFHAHMAALVSNRTK